MVSKSVWKGDLRAQYNNELLLPSFIVLTINKLDVDPQRDDDASPMSTYKCMSRPT